MFNLGNFKRGHFHLISDENKILPYIYFPIHIMQRWPTLAIARDHLVKKGTITPSKLNTDKALGLVISDKIFFHVFPK